MPKSYDRCVKKAEKKEDVNNPYAYCHPVMERHKQKVRRKKGG